MDDLFDELRAVVTGLAFGAKRYDSGDKSKERVVLAHADIGAGKDAGTPLTDDDGACRCFLSIRELHAEEFRL